jgi:uncharacterized protein related to proFAR isomerase
LGSIPNWPARRYLNMTKFDLQIDKKAEMMRISIDGKNVFLGNYWDFDMPNTLIKLLKSINNMDLDIVYKDIEV